MKAGRTDEALRILGNLRADGDASSPRVLQEYDDIVEIVALERKHAGRNTYFAMLFGTGAFLQYVRDRRAILRCMGTSARWMSGTLIAFFSLPFRRLRGLTRRAESATVSVAADYPGVRCYS